MVMKTKKKLSTFFALILCSVMLTGFMPAAVFADEPAPVQAAEQGTESTELQNEKSAGAGTSAPAKVEGKENEASEEQKVENGASGKISRAEASAPEDSRAEEKTDGLGATDEAADENSRAEETDGPGATDGGGVPSDTVIPAVRMAQKAVRATDGADASSDTGSDIQHYDVSKSKTATQLDTGTWTSDITLSLPSAEEPLTSDVVFVLDGSSSADTNVVKESLSLLEKLKEATEDGSAAVNVCVVKFKRQAYKSDWFDLSTNYDAIKKAMETKYSGGTNIHAGLLAGKAALEDEKHKDIPASRKYLVLVSDGSTYLYSKDGDWASPTPFTRSYHPAESYNDPKVGCLAGSFNDQGYYEPNNFPDVNVPRPQKSSSVDDWQKYLKDVEERNVESKGDDYDYHCNYDLNFNQGKPSKDFKSQPCVERSANNRDMAYYYADQVWQEIKKAGYNAYSIATEDGSAGAGNADDSHCFMNYLNGGKSLNFGDIEHKIIYAVDEGSSVIDTMGYVEGDYNFDFVNDAASIYVTVGSERLNAEKVEENVEETVYGFGGHENNDGEVSYDFHLIYKPANDGTEHIEWNLHVPVTNLRHVQLHYRVKLMNPKTVPGTYGTYDRDGSKGYDGLYTNNKATLYPQSTIIADAAPATDKGEDFPKPTVSYTVNESGAPEAKPEAEPKTTPAGYGTVHFYKVDGQTGAKLPGAEFSLYKYNGEYVGSYTTDQNGGITVYNILYGSYYFTETKAPDGYTLDPTYVKFTLDSSEMNVKFSNTAATVPTMLVGGIKTWNDNNNAAGARPASITLHLFANGVEVGTTQATADTNWQYTFGVQPVNGTDGKAIVYSLSEDSVRNYTTAIAAPVTAENAMVINVTNTYKTAAIQSAGIATGDDSHMALYGMISLITGVGVVGLFIRKKIF